MSRFLNNLLSRHLEPNNNIKPRVRGRFEPVNYGPGVFSGYDNEFSATDPALHPVTDDTVQSVSLLQPFHPDFSGEQATIPEQFLPFGKLNEETEAVYREPSPLIRPRFSPIEENRTKQHGETENTANKRFSFADIQTYSPVLRENTSDEEVQTRVPEEHFSQSNSESQTAGFLAKKTFARRKVSFIHLDSGADETVKPVLKKYNRDGFESNNGGVQGSLPQSSPLRQFDSSSVQGLHETSHQPVIRVTIGRIDVRAVVQAASTPVKSTARAKPKLSLEDYLKQRNNNTA
jgi:hypothetical protein